MAELKCRSLPVNRPSHGVVDQILTLLIVTVGLPNQVHQVKKVEQNILKFFDYGKCAFLKILFEKKWGKKS